MEMTIVNPGKQGSCRFATKPSSKPKPTHPPPLPHAPPGDDGLFRCIITSNVDPEKLLEAQKNVRLYGKSAKASYILFENANETPKEKGVEVGNVPLLTPCQ
jgi:hypothetical protein